MKKYCLILVLGLIVFGLFATSSQLYAAPVVVTSRAALAGNDFIDWGGFGAELTLIPSPSTIGSNTSAITATVSMPSGQFRRVDQSSGWIGNFAPGDHLLFTNGFNGPIDITFSQPVNGAGVQIQYSLFGPFTATINVYDASNNLIGSFSLAGNSTSNADNSAIFLGVMDSAPTIKRIEYNTTNNTFSINQLGLIDPPVAKIPTMNEWGLIVFTALAGLGSVYYLRRQRKA